MECQTSSVGLESGGGRPNLLNVGKKYISPPSVAGKIYPEVLLDCVVESTETSFGEERRVSRNYRRYTELIFACVCVVFKRSVMTLTTTKVKSSKWKNACDRHWFIRVG